MNKLDLDGLVVIGGDDSNTNACLLAENFRLDFCLFFTSVFSILTSIDEQFQGKENENTSHRMPQDN